MTLKQGALEVGDDWVTLATEVASGSGAVAVRGSRVYATAAEATTARPAGAHLTVGPVRKMWQQVLWRCELAHCDRAERIPLDVLSGEPGREVMAVGPAGQVLIVRVDRAVLLTTAP